MRLINNLYDLDCQWFRQINRYFNHRVLNRLLKTVTHLGGARFTIIFTLLLILLTRQSIQMTAIASAVSLVMSHLPAAIVKKYFPRQRPYLMLEQINVLANPLKDHSFPSGHTTAIFSIIIPFILIYPPLAVILLPIGMLVGVSRIFLGLHYPSDVITGMVLATLTAISVFSIIQSLFPIYFI